MYFCKEIYIGVFDNSSWTPVQSASYVDCSLKKLHCTCLVDCVVLVIQAIFHLLSHLGLVDVVEIDIFVDKGEYLYSWCSFFHKHWLFVHMFLLSDSTEKKLLRVKFERQLFLCIESYHSPFLLPSLDMLHMCPQNVEPACSSARLRHWQAPLFGLHLGYLLIVMDTHLYKMCCERFIANKLYRFYCDTFHSVSFCQLQSSLRNAKMFFSWFHWNVHCFELFRFLRDVETNWGSSVWILQVFEGSQFE